MKLFNRNDSTPLTTAENADNAAAAVNYLLYGVLGAVVLTTGAHAIMLVLNTTDSFATDSASGGLFYALLNVLRVSWPSIVEVAAVAVGLGFIKAKWRGGQKGIGTALEITWFLFAAANMITFFAIERGAELQGWQSAWVQYGLPLSALVVAALTYKLLKANPAHKRANERALAEEQRTAAEENARLAVDTSDAMMTVHERRAWREKVHSLKAQGYDEEEIGFMTDHIPSLNQLHEQREKGPASEPEKKPGLVDRAKAKLGLGDEADDTAYDAPRQDANAPTTATPPGQGATGRLHPDDVAAIAAVVAQMSAPVPAPTVHANGQETQRPNG